MTDAEYGEYEARLKSILDKPGFADEVCANIANGGDLVTVAQNLNIRYSDLWKWSLQGIGMVRMFEADKARQEWTRQRVLNELRAMAFTDLREAFYPDGSLKNPQDWPDAISRALASVDTDELFGFDEETGKRKRVGETKKIKFHSKIDALKLIGSEFGLFIQKHKLQVVDTLEELVAGSFDKPADDSK